MMSMHVCIWGAKKFPELEEEENFEEQKKYTAIQAKKGAKR